MSFHSTRIPNPFAAPRPGGRPLRVEHSGGSLGIGGAATYSRLPTIRDVAEVGGLLWTFRDRTRWAGVSPGSDGLTWNDFGGSEAAAAFRAVSNAILAETFRPHPERRVGIPRPGRSPRPLDIGTVVDRTVAARLADLMAPVLDNYLGPSAFAYRPGRSYLELLARLAAAAEVGGLVVVGNHDVADAFPSAPLDGVMAAHRRLADDLLDRSPPGADRGRRRDENGKLLRLVEVVLGGTGGSRRRGLSQGNPYSPSAFELFMHTTLDSVWGPSDPPLLRYADNVVPLTGGVPEGRLARSRCRDLLGRVGLRLKEPVGPDEETVVDLSAGGTTQLLGFVLSMTGGRMTFGIGDESWASLGTSLAGCHSAPNPPGRADSVLAGWVAALGPAFETRREAEVIGRLTLVARGMGFRETDPGLLSRVWQSARDAWVKTRERARTDDHSAMVTGR